MDDVITTVIAAAADYDLTDLSTVKSELGITNTTSDAFLGRGISQVSKAVSNECNRVFQVETLSDLFYLDRHRQVLQDDNKVQLSRFPVLSVASVVEDAGLDTEYDLIQGTDYLLIPNTGILLRLEPSIGLRRRWRSKTLTVQYDAGYGTPTSNATTIPATPGPYTITPAVFDIDKGVVFTGGAALVAVPGAPAEGQYNIAAGIYTFNSADQGRSVTISFISENIPYDLVEATLRMVTLRYKQQGRDPMQVQLDQPGIGTQRWWVGTTPGQDGVFPPDIAGLLDNYRTPVIS